MRIGLLGSRGYPSTYGGFETFVREFAPAAAAGGHQVIVYCRGRAARRRSWTVDGVECRWSPGIDTQHLSTLSFGLSSACDARRRRLDAALVLNCANGYWLPLLRSAGIPVAVNVDGVEWGRGKWNRLGRRVFLGGAEMSARWADALVGDSRAIVELWDRRFGRRPRYIPYGARLLDDDAGDALEALAIRPGSYVLTVARLVPENNVELTLDALAGLGGQGGELTHVVVGSAQRNSRIEDRLHALSEGSAPVRWLGHVANQRLLGQLYRHCRAYVHGHSVGGTNPALLEALGAGAPVLAFDTAFNREVIGAGGVYYESAAALKAQLARLLDSAELRGELAAAGRARVAERYTWPDICQRYLELLAELGAGRR